MSRELTLVGIPYSPWSEKARWALDHHRVSHRFSEYSPLLGEVPLRLRLGKLGGRVSVPVLFGSERPVADSLEIARQAERGGGGASLFPDASLDAILAWNARSDQALAIGRALALTRMRASPACKEATLPSFVPAALRPWGRAMAGVGIAFIARKYRLSEAAGRPALEQVLTGLREALGGSERRYLLGTFCYADLTMAVALQFVAPPADDALPLHPAIRECFTDPEVAAKFADLVRWRDWLYAEHRARPAA